MFRSTLLVGVFVVGAMAPMSASASAAAAPTVAQAATAVQFAGDAAIDAQAPVAIADAASPAELPVSATDGLDIGPVSLGLPTAGAPRSTGGAVVLSGTDANTTVVAQPVSGGGRATVLIENAAAPTTYRFPVEGATRLEMLADGSVAVYGPDGVAAGGVDLPWARDAEGRMVPTWYTVDGLSLVQHVDHTGGNYAYPVAADPFFIVAGVALKCASGAYLGWLTAKGAGLKHWYGKALAAAAGCVILW